MDNGILTNKAVLFFLNSILIIILVTMCVHSTSKRNIVMLIKDMGFVTSFFTTIFMVCDMILRLNHFLAQRMCINSECNVDVMTAFKNIFGLNVPAITLLVVNMLLFMALIIIIRRGPLSYIEEFSPLVCIPCSLLSWILLRLTNFSDSNLQHSSPISLMEGLDYGTGMAYSYYYGYLKIVLPSLGTLNKGLFERIENVEDIHNITIASHKLIILIPSSAHIPPDLKEASYQWMESAIIMEEQRDRAGIKKRLYRNNVYKIYVNGKKVGSPVYVVAEGATPLLTFYEVQKHAHPETEIYQKYRDDIIQMFYKKLKELLDNDPECADLCELIYYNDRDSNGTRVNVAKVILERLQKLQTID